MANINDSFPSKYLKASDIDGQPTITIANVEFEEVGQTKDMRPILYFDGSEKGIVLNKTNATNISKLYGSETDDWIGKKVLLGTAWVDFQGQSVEAIRIYPPKQRPAKSVNAPLAKTATGRKFDDEQREFAPLPEEGDDIPF